MFRAWLVLIKVQKLNSFYKQEILHMQNTKDHFYCDKICIPAIFFIQI